MTGLIFVLIVAGLYALAFILTSRCRLCWAIVAAVCFGGAALAVRALESAPRSLSSGTDPGLALTDLRQASAESLKGGGPSRGKADFGYPSPGTATL